MAELNFSNSNILVIGDIILDKYFSGKVERISPEAPVPVVKIKKQTAALGGAGNVVNNLVHLGASAYIISITGRDSDRDLLIDLLKEIKVKNNLIEIKTPTTSKIRIIGGHQQVARLDFEEIPLIDQKIVSDIIKFFDKNINEAGAVIISDYGKGVCTPELCRYIIDSGNKKEKTIIVDPKGDNWEKYSGADFITPNVNELGLITGKIIQNTDSEITGYAREIIKKYNVKNLLVTRSEKGMSLISGSESFHIPTEAREVFDVSGAGDTVVAALAVSLASGAPLQEAVMTANRAAGIAVSKFGTAPVSFEELVHSMHGGIDSKILNEKVSAKILEQLIEKGSRIIFVPGIFDDIKLDHLRFLREARKKGDLLIAGIKNGESYVKTIKNNEGVRAEIISSMEFVDYVIIENNDNFSELAKKYPAISVIEYE